MSNVKIFEAMVFAMILLPILMILQILVISIFSMHASVSPASAFVCGFALYLIGDECENMEEKEDDTDKKEGKGG